MNIRKRKQKQSLFRAINSCKELLREPFLRAQEMQTLYRNGKTFQLLQSEANLLKALPLLLPTLNEHQLAQIENFARSLTQLSEKKAEIDAILPDFLAKETKLKNDNLTFINAVKETQTKHDLSPDWNGKKAVMIQLGTQLQARHEVYEQEEKQLHLKIEKLYLLHTDFYQEFSLFCEQLLPQLEDAFAALCKPLYNTEQ